MRYALAYGMISGFVIIATMLAGLLLTGQESFFSSELFGYLVMLTALTFVFVGVKQYRDIDQGGAIRFGPAFRVGLAIATVASLTYVGVWEAYLATTDYAFIDEYFNDLRAARRAAGGTAAHIATGARELDELRVQYENPLIRVPKTFGEIFPVGLLVAVVSAALLRKPRLLPAGRHASESKA